MSIVNTKYDDVYGVVADHKCCDNCGERLYHYPFLYWSGVDDDILLCSECCKQIKRGLIADIIQLAAIAELRDIGYGVNTLVRSNVAQLDEEGKQLEEEERKARALTAAIKNEGK
jgi:hypothetical protein